MVRWDIVGGTGRGRSWGGSQSRRGQMRSVLRVMLARWVQAMLVWAALVRQGDVTALAEDRYIERVDSAGARTDEKGACGEGGVKGDVAFFVSDEPNVARARHAVDGRRELGTERVEVSELLAHKAPKHRPLYDPLARLACRWSLDPG